jgi:SAM-dependent methyltransferase
MPAFPHLNEKTTTSILGLLGPEAFSRMDETEDELFYARDRFVSHLDSRALATVESLIGTLIVEEKPVVLDLMAGWDSHIPKSLHPIQVVGLGLNPNELKDNKALTQSVLHDLNQDPRLPFPDSSFDAVINTVSVDYMTQPVRVFEEVGRVLRPGGLFLVIFSNRMFPQKAVKVWRQSSEPERIMLVEDFFESSGIFEDPAVFISKGKPRPGEDKYASLGIPSDPIYAVYAEKRGGLPNRKPRPSLNLLQKENTDMKDLMEREKMVKETLQCPHCGETMKKWAVPQGPFTEWDNEFMYICFNDACPYLVRGWEVMEKQGNRGISYRCMYHPEKDVCMPVPVPSLGALKESIVQG